MTYLELVNKVLIKLREDTVGSISESEYSRLIAEFVNEAKEEVEDAWDWSMLRKSVTFNSDGINRAYDLTEGTTIVHSGDLTNNRSKLIIHPITGEPLAYDITSGSEFQLELLPLDEITKRVNLAIVPTTTTNAYPTVFGLSRQTGDGFTVNFDFIPPTGRQYRLYHFTPQEPLEDDADSIVVPWRPVVLLATMYALNERGEELGEPGNLAERKYINALGNAIALDATTARSKLTFTPS